MKPYGTMREHPMDNKRRYLNGRMSHEDRREERHDKRVARANGRSEIEAQVASMFGGMDADDLAHEQDILDGRVPSPPAPPSDTLPR